MQGHFGSSFQNEFLTIIRCTVYAYNSTLYRQRDRAHIDPFGLMVFNGDLNRIKKKTGLASFRENIAI